MTANLVAALDCHAAERGDRPALICGTETIAYRELAANSAAVARALAASGIGPGDRVVHVAESSSAVYEMLYGCARLGAILVPVNPRLADAEIGYIVAHCRAGLVVAEDPDRIDITGPVLASRHFAEWREGAEGTEIPSFPADSDTRVVQMYTSGTTGRPKGVVLAHRTFFAVRGLLDAAGLDWIDWRPGDISLIALPAFHIGGMWWAAQGLNSGVPNVLLPRFTAAAAITAVREHGVTVSCFVPAMIQLMLAEPGFGAVDFATLRKIAYGGSPIGPELLGRAMTTMDCEFAQIYGLTETGNTAICLPPDQHTPGQVRWNAAGRPYPGVDLSIRRPDNSQAETGESGEVYLRSPAQMLEYHDDPDATAATLVDGWIRTGDAGYLDADGYLVIRDRVKDLIIVAGENVYPAEVEKAINAHPAVLDSAVIGAPDDRWGEAVHAFIVAEPGAEPPLRDLVRFLNERLARYKVPLKYEFVTTIPRNPSGKILKRALRDRFWAGRDRQVN
ncbi:AMP-binding protein [Nocardia sp. NPDC051030]|uniref:AMP-binding protein n=1 Tax=Nocardia sp. NPDC051030 TaxID=3155162 RepID=UPI00343770E3